MIGSREFGESVALLGGPRMLSLTGSLPVPMDIPE
jgi:hypothetical protein